MGAVISTRAAVDELVRLREDMMALAGLQRDEYEKHSDGLVDAVRAAKDATFTVRDKNGLRLVDHTVRFARELRVVELVCERTCAALATGGDGGGSAGGLAAVLAQPDGAQAEALPLIAAGENVHLNIDMFEYLLAPHPEAVTATDKFGRTVMHTLAHTVANTYALPSDEQAQALTAVVARVVELTPDCLQATTTGGERPVAVLAAKPRGQAVLKSVIPTEMK